MITKSLYKAGTLNDTRVHLAQKAENKVATPKNIRKIQNLIIIIKPF